jgi:hypothetical protein
MLRDPVFDLVASCIPGYAHNTRIILDLPGDNRGIKYILGGYGFRSLLP